MVALAGGPRSTWSQVQLRKLSRGRPGSARAVLRSCSGVAGWRPAWPAAFLRRQRGRGQGSGSCKGRATFGPQASVRVAASGVPFPRVAQAVQAALRVHRGSGAAIGATGSARLQDMEDRRDASEDWARPPAGCDGCHGGPPRQLPLQERNLILNLQSQLLHARFAVGRAGGAGRKYARHSAFAGGECACGGSATGCGGAPPGQRLTRPTGRTKCCFATALPRVGARALRHWRRRVTGSGG